jgi:hypothetical protein
VILCFVASTNTPQNILTIGLHYYKNKENEKVKHRSDFLPNGLHGI